jgi:hypothetical protein
MAGGTCAPATTTEQRARSDVAIAAHRKRATEAERLQPNLHSVFAADLDLIVLHSPDPGRSRGGALIRIPLSLAALGSASDGWLSSTSA